MYNLILKDIFLIKKRFILALLYIPAMALAFQGSGLNMAVVGIVGGTYILITTACAYDDKNNSDIMLNSLPIKRSKIVLSKYITIYFYTSIGIISYLLISNLINIMNINIEFYTINLEGVIGVLFSITLINSIYFPIYFKLGYLKTRVVSMLLFIGMFVGFGSFSSLLVNNKISNEFLLHVFSVINTQSDIVISLVMIGIMILIQSISIMISLKFYRNREF
ncbi:ABC-2 transporter permease [Clostridium sp. D2Q-11]|uniref:ABC-2 transporter permease n=1 Tax=Anaeromonas frigoriresistens TaxID=2683708 RepID=A0A942UQL4_9FIRM|nr:ABC-2 transporter permease [Anaeromonas frigoriresistens]MBS4537479.1 ABC-2 transporter permease [Anaeromonas frigoriresistens]